MPGFAVSFQFLIEIRIECKVQIYLLIHLLSTSVIFDLPFAISDSTTLVVQLIQKLLNT